MPPGGETTPAQLHRNENIPSELNSVAEPALLVVGECDLSVVLCRFTGENMLRSAPFHLRLTLSQAVTTGIANREAADRR
jgi:hypothetical protein